MSDSSLARPPAQDDHLAVLLDFTEIVWHETDATPRDLNPSWSQMLDAALDYVRDDARWAVPA
ncbi:hypothetical protein [Mycobacterium branderi]|uniref:Uncharacterized protein n=1 Tax=Mycobacterium branderi TaxID=43348 RepID=A0A7I7VX57_9MYCO|nr:hypothetical protein [Mycobacterium branderi]MCV7232798.1 hypothetical protein [Mycobacterium branderi]ORA40931.1 hypothetical protein BST20_01930 [Mycobacterium branderi]BBZ09827.1 hypothetical protein MBRA_00220 [Mycobacterium branderi]BBZ09899.1 hypothetical protein MBRA_00940 [Mycobacterium branderi]